MCTERSLTAEAALALVELEGVKTKARTILSMATAVTTDKQHAVDVLLHVQPKAEQEELMEVLMEMDPTWITRTCLPCMEPKAAAALLAGLVPVKQAAALTSLLTNNDLAQGDLAGVMLSYMLTPKAAGALVALMDGEEEGGMGGGGAPDLAAAAFADMETEAAAALAEHMGRGRFAQLLAALPDSEMAAGILAAVSACLRAELIEEMMMAHPKEGAAAALAMSEGRVRGGLLLHTLWLLF
jgi:hypothetical protein